MVKWFISLLTVAALANASYTGPQTAAEAPVLPKNVASPMYQPQQSYVPQPPQQQAPAPLVQPAAPAPQASIYAPVQLQPAVVPAPVYAPAAPAPQPYGQPQQTPVRPSFDCRSKSDGLYELGRCQSTYIQCLYGEASLATCPANLVFAKDRCDYTNDCLNPTQPPPQQQQPVSGYARQQQFSKYGKPMVQQAPPKPVETFCQQNNFIEGYHAQGCSHDYFACFPLHTLRLNCPANLYYDIEMQRCDYKHLIKSCGGHRPPPPAQSPSKSPYGSVQPESYAPAPQQQPPAPQTYSAPQTYAAPAPQQQAPAA
uniref:Chitin-binding type-2 domain-containing protein n=1 Tax=Panagrolaimus sp. ES5 TaxID=591445 RepID=A0AC34F1J0_9BILA